MYLEDYMDLPDGGAVVRAQRIERSPRHQRLGAPAAPLGTLGSASANRSNWQRSTRRLNQSKGEPWFPLWVDQGGRLIQRRRRGLGIAESIMDSRLGAQDLSPQLPRIERQSLVDPLQSLREAPLLPAKGGLDGRGRPGGASEGGVGGDPLAAVNEDPRARL